MVARGGQGQSIAGANMRGQGRIGVPFCRGVGSKGSACVTQNDVAGGRTKVVMVHCSRCRGNTDVLDIDRHALCGGGVAVTFEADIVRCGGTGRGQGQVVAGAYIRCEGRIAVPFCRGVGAKGSAE